MNHKNEVDAADNRIFRALTPETASKINSLLSGQSSRGLLDFGRGRDAPSARELLYMANSKSHFIRTVHDNVSNRFEGVIGIMDIDNFHGVAVIWGARPLLLRPRCSDASNITRSACRWVFQNTPVQCIQAWSIEFNRPSIRAMTRAGFIETGRHRSAHIYNGKRYDRILFDLTADEFYAYELNLGESIKPLTEVVGVTDKRL
jgi:hypothetical protein